VKPRITEATQQHGREHVKAVSEKPLLHAAEKKSIKIAFTGTNPKKPNRASMRA
jgi:ribosomal protein S12